MCSLLIIIRSFFLYFFSFFVVVMNVHCAFSAGRLFYFVYMLLFIAVFFFTLSWHIVKRFANKKKTSDESKGGYRKDDTFTKNTYQFLTHEILKKNGGSSSGSKTDWKIMWSLKLLRNFSKVEFLIVWHKNRKLFDSHLEISCVTRWICFAVLHNISYLSWIEFMLLHFFCTSSGNFLFSFAFCCCMVGFFCISWSLLKLT